MLDPKAIYTAENIAVETGISFADVIQLLTSNGFSERAGVYLVTGSEFESCLRKKPDDKRTVEQRMMATLQSNRDAGDWALTTWVEHFSGEFSRQAIQKTKVWKHLMSLRQERRDGFRS